MKKGFTLMEILAVLLVIAVLASFAVPLVRSVMADVRYRRARVAGSKMAEAIRIFFTDSKGFRISGSINGIAASELISAEDDCHNPALDGLPPYDTSNSGDIDVSQLFHCNYLTGKDFAGLNYIFDPGYCLNVSTSGCLVAVMDMSGKNNKGCFLVNVNGETVPQASNAACGGSGS